jgi:hypothetical protein
MAKTTASTNRTDSQWGKESWRMFFLGDITETEVMKSIRQFERSLNSSLGVIFTVIPPKNRIFYNEASKLTDAYSTGIEAEATNILTDIFAVVSAPPGRYETEKKPENICNVIFYAENDFVAVPIAGELESLSFIIDEYFRACGRRANILAFKINATPVINTLPLIAKRDCNTRIGEARFLKCMLEHGYRRFPYSSSYKCTPKTC